MANAQQVLDLRNTINARANAMRTQTLGSTRWRRAYDNLLTALRQARSIIQEGRGQVVDWVAEGVRAPTYPITHWNAFLNTANRQAESAMAEASLVALGSTRRPSEGGQTLAQLRAAQAATARAAAGIPEGYAFAPQDAPAATAEDIAWERRQRDQASRVASVTPVPPASTSQAPAQVPPATTGKPTPTAAQIAAIGQQQAGAPQVVQAGMMPSGTLASVRNWLNPGHRPVYLRPWFLATGATAVSLLAYFSYQAVTEKEEEVD
jgi:hypothetical protein